MNFSEVLRYAKDNHKEINEEDAKLLGFAYSPDDEVDFFILDISYDPDTEEVDETEVDSAADGSYHCYLLGGDIPESHAIEGYYSGDSISELEGELPDFASKLNYIAFPQAESISGLNIDYAFSLLFPDLPSADDMANDYGQKKFKAAVIAAIDRTNNQAQ